MPWQGHSSLASRKKSGSFASTSGQQQTSETENESAAFIKDGIRARHKQRAALATMDDILNLYAREGPQEPSIFFCRGYAHLHASQALAFIWYASLPSQMLTYCSLTSTYAVSLDATGCLSKQLTLEHDSSKSTEENYTPYDLSILDGPPATGSYYTITPTGVTLHAKGQTAELTPMSDWIREREVYELIRKIPFFQQYIICRAYRLWKTVCPCILHCWTPSNRREDGHAAYQGPNTAVHVQ